MTNRVLLGVGRHMIPVPGFVWQPLVRASARKSRAGLASFSEDHHRVRDFAVRELAGVGAPLGPEVIAEALDLELAHVVAILDDLEARKTFVFRGDGEAVSWAYPVTVDVTPHRAHLSTGEDAYSP